MRKNIVISLILLIMVICSPYYLYVCSAQANGDQNTPTFELNLEPTDPMTWEDWRPKYKTNTSFIATLKGTTASNESVQFASATFTFYLGTPSQWEGVCMNYDGDTDIGTSYDLFIRRDDNPGGSGQTHTVTHPIVVPGEDVNVSGQPVEIGLGLTITGTGNSGTVSVRVNDHAAVSILSVSATFNYVDPLSGSTTPTGSADDTTISIPLDNNGNDIADGWEDDHIHDYNPWDDNENGPGFNMHTGDGLTVFEEYRGFIVQGEPEYTKPTEKDVFIFSEFTYDGIGYTDTAAGLKAHKIEKNELYLPPDEEDWRPVDGFNLDDKMLSVNHQTCTDGYYGQLLQVVKQHAIWVMDEPSEALGALGRTQGNTAFPGAPHEIMYIAINKEQISETDAEIISSKSSHNVEWPQGTPETPGARRSEMIKRTITHEVGHAIGLYHPFNAIPDHRPAARVRYHDRVTYLRDNTICREEDDDPNDNTPGSHHADRCGAVGAHLTWDSGSTVMDYGSEHLVYDIYMDINGLEKHQAEYLADLEKSTQYLSPLHDVEYLFVMPNVLAVHRAKQLPNLQRKNKPQWTPPDGDDTGTSGSDDTNLDSQGTDTTLPHAPTSLSLSAGNGQVSLSLTGGSGTITDYQYRYRVSGGSWSSWISAGLVTLFDVLGLTNGTTYEFQVRAMNGESASTASDSFEETPATVPGAPTNLSGYGYNGWVSLSWTAPSDNGGATITDYEYRYSRTSQSFGSSWTLAGGINTLKSVFGLTNGTQYKFQVRAKNSAGVSTESNTANATPVTVPGIPQNVTSTAGDGEVSLYWDAPNSNGGSTITDYEYSYRAGTSGYFSDWTDVGNVLSTTVSGLTNDTLYQFRVLATNGVGDGSWAGPEDETPEATITTPGAPIGLDVAVAINGIVIFTWDAPSDDGGATIEGYEYQYREEGTSTWSSWTYVTYRAALITGLTNGTTYEIQVRAVNSEGSGTISDILRATPIVVEVRPGVPQNLSATAGDGQVELSWDAPDFDGNTAITGYEYALDTNNNGTWAAWTSTGNGTTTSVKYGGHHDRKNGGYHYHNPGTVPRSTTKSTTPTPSRTTTPNLNLPNSISKGSLPYTPSRIEWLSLVAQSASNATGLGSDYSILLTIDRKDTIFINILGKPPGATTQNIDEVIRTTRKLIMEIAESYKWESWVKIEVRK